jgi:hypothetical protein
VHVAGLEQLLPREAPAPSPVVEEGRELGRIGGAGGTDAAAQRCKQAHHAPEVAGLAVVLLSIRRRLLGCIPDARARAASVIPRAAALS